MSVSDTVLDQGLFFLMNKCKLAGQLILKIVLFILILGVLLFIPAGSLRYWEAWVYCGVMSIPTLIFSFYALVRDPEFLERRMKSGEKEAQQRIVMNVSGLLFMIGLILAGLDHRYGWSRVPNALVLASNAAVLVSFLLVYRVFKENRYAASTIEVEEGQPVISSGPYAIVRHPMYLSVLPMYLFTPLALGSYWALLAFLPLPLLLVMRIINEEEVLVRELPGYEDYRRKVRWRLIPGVW